MPNEQEPAQANTPKEPEVKYVLSGQPTGWWAAAKDVRDFDVEKVTSCKEDIDTLLVFAGLFSAVLSAFLVAVYPNLQQQPSDRIVYAIERVATQTAGYRVNLTDGTLIAASILPPFPPSFQVSDDDIRVNALWFASLIISLVTASFGMLVKQWLREFLASEDPSAPHRLRLRHFREPQMKAWMVYEIAGLLPILLHLSLGLFFVGLCYFTSSVHATIKRTTIPLVVGWALCFFAATSLPLFFPRCPYKVAFLKVLIVRLHRLVRGFARWLYPPTDERARDSEDDSSNEDDTNNEGEDTGQFFVAAVRQVTATWVKCCLYTKSRIQAVVTAMQDMKSRIQAVVTATQDMKNLFTAAVKAARNIPDEAILVESSDFDLDILSSVDGIQGNDEMLAAIIPEALLYTRPASRDVVELIIQLLEHRVPTVEPSRRVVEYWPFHNMAPLNNLRPQARNHILSILSSHIKDLDIGGECYPRCVWAVSDSQSPADLCLNHIAVFRALFLIISAPRESLLPSAVKFLQQYFEVADLQPSFWRLLCLRAATTDNDLSLGLDQALIVIRAINNLTNTGQIQLSLDHRVKLSAEISHPYFPNLVDKHIDTTTYPWDTWQLADSYDDVELKFSCMVFWLHAASEGLNTLHSETSADPSPLVTSVVGFSLRQFHGCWMGSSSYNHMAVLHAHRELVYNGFRKMARVAVEKKNTALVFTSALLDEFQPPPHFEYSMPLIGGIPLLHMLRSSYNRDQSIQTPLRDPAVIQAICLLVMSKIAMYQEQKSDITFTLGLYQVLAFFLITIYVPPDLRKECRSIFSSLATSLSVPPPQASLGLRDSRPMALAQDCLEIMIFEDCASGQSDRPHSEEGSIFPDILLDTLLTLSGEEGRDFLPRTLKTQPAIEPGTTSVAITGSASTSNQAFDASDLTPSTSGEEPQPTYAMQDVEQTKAAHEEEGNDIYV